MRVRTGLIFGLALLMLGACSNNAPAGSGGAGIVVSDAFLPASPGMKGGASAMSTPAPTMPGLSTPGATMPPGM